MDGCKVKLSLDVEMFPWFKTVLLLIVCAQIIMLTALSQCSFWNATLYVCARPGRHWVLINVRLSDIFFVSRVLKWHHVSYTKCLLSLMPVTLVQWSLRNREVGIILWTVTRQVGRLAGSVTHSLTRILCYWNRAGIDRRKLEKGRGRANLNEDISVVSKSV